MEQTPLISSELNSKLNKAKIGLLTKQGSVFISTVLFSVKFIWDDSVKTAKINSKELKCNPTFFNDIDKEERVFILAHEAWHLCFKHSERQGRRQVKRWGKACDYAINAILFKAGYKLIDGVLINNKFFGKSTEQIYELLPEEPDDYRETTQPDIADTERVNSILMKAYTQSKMSNNNPSNIPGNVLRYIDELRKPTLPWYTLLNNYMVPYKKEDYSYRRPRRRYLPDLYLPGLYSEGIRKIAAAYDLSGSINDEMIKTFSTELHSLKIQLNPQIMEIIGFDAKVTDIHILKPEDNVLDLKFTGGGGTSLYPVFEYFRDKKPDVLIVFSDLCCRKIQEDPRYDVIWICVNNPHGEVNFGKLIHYQTD